jgi:hypothetical protein
MPRRHSRADTRADDATDGELDAQAHEVAVAGKRAGGADIGSGLTRSGCADRHPNGHPNVHAMKVSVAYADGIRGDPTVPSPWDGDPGVLFIGGGVRFDAGAIRIANPSAQPLTVDNV